jgi:hypothetical protein
MSARLMTFIFLACLVLFLIAGAPLSAVAGFAAGEERFTYERTSGTIWDGALHGVRVGDHSIGDLALELNPFHLVFGRLRYGFSFRGRGNEGRGIAEIGLGSHFALRDTTARLQIERTPSNREIAGTVSLGAVTLVVDDKGCRLAEGTVLTDILMHSVQDLEWRGPELAGILECREGILRIPFSGVREREAVNVEAEFFPDRRYHARIRLETENPNLSEILPLFGFTFDGGVFAFEQSGQWRDGRMM